ncbi:MAG: hypothetical protein PWP23_2859 [Candidatus Sumerlaeota bacterium]|nr:hypothetical protein [Candidatus Sumerlaeota bacterium]
MGVVAEGDEPMLKTPANVTKEDARRVNEALDDKIRKVRAFPGFLGGLLDNVRVLRALLRDKSFKIDWTHKAQIIACLLYFISPIDLIPDIIIGVGFVDDAFVVGYGMKVLGDIVADYKRFRAARGAGAPPGDGVVDVPAREVQVRELPS